MTFKSLFPTFIIFEAKMNALSPNIVGATDENFYNGLFKRYPETFTFKYDDSVNEAKVFGQWSHFNTIIKKVFLEQQKSIKEAIQNNASAKNYTGTQEELANATSQYLDNGSSSVFTPAILDVLRSYINLPNIYQQLEALFSQLFSTMSSISQGGIPLDEHVRDRVTTNYLLELLNNSQAFKNLIATHKITHGQITTDMLKDFLIDHQKLGKKVIDKDNLNDNLIKDIVEVGEIPEHSIVNKMIHNDTITIDKLAKELQALINKKLKNEPIKPNEIKRDMLEHEIINNDKLALKSVEEINLNPEIVKKINRKPTLEDDDVTTPKIKDKNVTAVKLSDELNKKINEGIQVYKGHSEGMTLEDLIKLVTKNHYTIIDIRGDYYYGDALNVGFNGISLLGTSLAAELDKDGKRVRVARFGWMNFRKDATVPFTGIKITYPLEYFTIIQDKQITKLKLSQELQDSYFFTKQDEKEIERPILINFYKLKNVGTPIHSDERFMRKGSELVQQSKGGSLIGNINFNDDLTLPGGIYIIEGRIVSSDGFVMRIINQDANGNEVGGAVYYRDSANTRKRKISEPNFAIGRKGDVRFKVYMSNNGKTLDFYKGNMEVVDSIEADYQIVGAQALHKDPTQDIISDNNNHLKIEIKNGNGTAPTQLLKETFIVIKKVIVQ